MKLTDLRPGYLYGFLERLSYDDNDQEKWGMALEDQKNQNVSEFYDSHLVEVVKCINEYVLESEKIDPKYIWQKAPEGYFERIGKKLLEDNYDMEGPIGYKLMKVFEKIHDEKATNFRYALGFGIYIESNNPAVVECLPIQYGGIYNVMRLANSVLPFLVHMGLNLITLDSNCKVTLSHKMEQAIKEYVQEYIDENSIYRFGHAVTELRFLQYSYDPIKIENAPAGKEKFFQRRIDELHDEYFGRKLIKIVGKVNPVFGENFWIPGDDE